MTGLPGVSAGPAVGPARSLARDLHTERTTSAGRTGIRISSLQTPVPFDRRTFGAEAEAVAELADVSARDRVRGPFGTEGERAFETAEIARRTDPSGEMEPRLVRPKDPARWKRGAQRDRFVRGADFEVDGSPPLAR